MPNRGEVRATADQLLHIIDDLRSIEERKRGELLGSPTFVELAERAVVQARLVYRWAEMELQMAQASATRVARGEQAPDIQLTSVVPRPVDRILANWREAQLRLEIARPDSPEAIAAAEDIERLREEHRATLDRLAETAAQLSGRPTAATR